MWLMAIYGAGVGIFLPDLGGYWQWFTVVERCIVHDKIPARLIDVPWLGKVLPLPIYVLNDMA